MSSSQFARSLSMAVGCGFVLLTIAPAAQATDENFLVSLFAELRKTGGISPEAEKRIQLVHRGTVGRRYQSTRTERAPPISDRFTGVACRSD